VAESVAPSAGRVFISYRREETAWQAGWLYDRLTDRFGRDQIFKDIDSIELGDDFLEAITTAVGSCDVLLALIGERWLTITDEHGRSRLDDADDFVRLEIEAALTRNVRVIPILVAGARMPRPDQLPPSLAKLTRRQALEVSPSHFESETSRLHKVLDRALPEMHAQPAITESQVPDATRSTSAQTLYVDAQEELRLGHFQTATDLLGDLLAREPNHQNAAQLRADASRQLHLADTYQRALDAQAASEWTDAANAYAEILEVDATYRDAKDRRDLCQEQEQLLDLQGELRHHAAAGQARGARQRRTPAIGDQTDPTNWEQSFTWAARDFDWQLVADIAQRYVDYLRGASTIEKTRQARSILDLLRKNRRYPELLLVADALMAQGVEDPAVRRLFALGLVDRNLAGAAALQFRTLIADPTISEDERAEALGGLGRCYKQLYLTSKDAGLRYRHLQLSLAAYQQAYQQNASRVWPGINVVALLSAAAYERIGLADHVDPYQDARRLAERILRSIDERPYPDAWAKATAMQACLALGDSEEALERAISFVDDRDADAFKIASTLRQLSGVWRLDPTRPPGDTLLPLLRSALLDQNGGTVNLDGEDLVPARPAQMSDKRLERVFGHDRYNTLIWYRNGLTRCRAVGQVQDLNEYGFGTGFVVNGKSLHPALPDRVFLTNSHVVPEGLPREEAIVRFRGLDIDVAPQRLRVARLWWQDPSRSPALDTAILELENLPEAIEPIPLANKLQRLDGPTPRRAYVIGHPRGLNQPQFSLQDNLLLDYDSTYVHYRSPTDPGSSGSPVFDDKWMLIAVHHHAGSVDTPRLNQRGGSYEANEGVRLSAIVEALRKRQPQPEQSSR
jgi:tetratricopeptide (TPR) repeat protein